MKHLKYLPFLIGAAAYVPRVHAAEIAQTEPGSLATVLICLLLVLLAAGGRRSESIKFED